MATCLDNIGSIVPLPGGREVLAAERTTGRIWRLDDTQDTPPVAFAAVPLAAGEVLTDFALSPTFSQDHLIYLYISGASESRVLRLAAGDSPKEILTGIAAGGTARSASGAIAFATDGALFIATGSDADGGAWTSSLLRLPTDPGASPTVLASGLASPADVCRDPIAGRMWLLDAGGASGESRLRLLLADNTLSYPIWTWPAGQGATGCAGAGGEVVVTLAAGTDLVSVDPITTTAIGEPQRGTEGYGRLAGAAIDETGRVWVGTVNKQVGSAGPTDDRVIITQFAAGGDSLV